MRSDYRYGIVSAIGLFVSASLVAEVPRVPSPSVPVNEVTIDSLDDLWRAVERADLKRVQLILTRGVDVNGRSKKDGWTALHIAALLRLEPIAAALLDSGADPNATSSDGLTPLMVTSGFIGGSAVQVAGIAVSAGTTNVDFAVKSRGVRFAWRSRDAAIARLLAARGANIEAEGGKSARTALLRAINAGQAGVVMALLAAGANPNHADADGDTPLIAVVGAIGGEEMAAALIAAKADPSLKNKSGQTALDVALAKKDEKVSGLLRKSMPPPPA